MKSYKIFFISLFILTSCAVKGSVAPIEYNHKKDTLQSTNSATPTLNNDGEIISNDFITSSDENKPDERDPDESHFILPNASPKELDHKIIYHEVNIGETIEDIAIKYNQSVKEIAALNDLYPPYYLDEFQVVKIKVKKEHKELKEDNTKENYNEEERKAEEVTNPNFIKPLDGKIISKFGETTSTGKNKGITIEAKQGSKILASASGKVIYADYDAIFGNLVIIKLDNNIITSYAHLEDIILFKGSSIKQGEVVGYVGSSGKAKTAQLHFAIRDGKTAKDPLQYVKY